MTLNPCTMGSVFFLIADFFSPTGNAPNRMAHIFPVMACTSPRMLHENCTICCCDVLGKNPWTQNISSDDFTLVGWVIYIYIWDITQVYRDFFISQIQGSQPLGITASLLVVSGAMCALVCALVLQLHPHLCCGVDLNSHCYWACLKQNSFVVLLL